MYSTKSIHKNINPNYRQTYTSIGDPYNGNGERLPGRWKEKQFFTQKHPKNADNGFFVKLKYQSDPYTEISEQYSKTQPLDSRKLGFGSRDVSKSGEFTCYKATQRYRSVVKQENKLLQLHRNDSKEKELLGKPKDPTLPPRDRNGRELKSAKFMFDIGRSCVTAYNPNSAYDSFYNLPKHAPVESNWQGNDPIRRLGSHRPSSTTIGEHAWKYGYQKPEHCRRSIRYY
ncbi:predicted protein [Thalassiosira pseudonana CCMP1335]|uniref:Uncharacterized protein n=1 Tax=Thalassiosira pseudonana TaxID=35128 RepID=B8BXP8_THAPS|nr:predicted protein [Thalassiosira pseudonana CCMP1335]EED94244.1 predicted protein [Thalassiosira pseudonana CCMP1335]|eukprot:scaffold3531_cov194-Alexandrium_tamarense.AAC.9